ncbi:MAG: FAD-linked oxidase C-terminal domain-containing protein [Bacteroidales bacterium]|nr:FAD-binding protein [Bacteroidales bacterium]MDD3701195.1 FAD-linked oxidase C-terminal domain-containing protein [Bacteroidales bacterium]MDY0368642.1 FAD-linked oxidase C-terminal domain-containing protein [Bacteroidales bacterium]
MSELNVYSALADLRQELAGDLLLDEANRVFYSTDASVYREKPLAVARPFDEQDVIRLVRFANERSVSLIPRAAGTSLAGQVVGNGIVVDVSRYMNRILEFNAAERWVKVQPGVILSELNQYLLASGLFFAPETSTADYCTIGGMVGNNACGANSLIYGSTRDHLIEMEIVLSNGNQIVVGPVSKKTFDEKCKLDSLEGALYRNMRDILSDPINQTEIRREYPDKELKRRNTGYAIDLLLDSEVFSPEGAAFNFCQLLAGSEGTLAFTTAIKLNLVPLPPAHNALVCVHIESVQDALQANLIALEFNPVAVELMDKTLLDLSKKNSSQLANRFFIQGDPAALLVVEFAEEQADLILDKVEAMKQALLAKSLGYHFPVVKGSDIQKVWALRKAGLGILNNMVGDAKPVAVVEDTAVHPKRLPEYITAFDTMLSRFDKTCVYYGHVSTGELHLRPVMNLKDPAEVELFYTIAYETARIVKQFKGSLSGEHGDGRLRGQFIPLMIGQTNYSHLKSIKQCWDADGIFNPHKIVDTLPMNSFLRYQAGQKTREFDTVFDFSADQGILRAAEKCNGTAVCRTTELTGRMMCPSYMAMRDEKTTTRARANLLREVLTYSNASNPFDDQALFETMELCLSCKACKSECPSSVDVAKLKAEFLQQYYDANRIPLRTRMIAHIADINHFGSFLPGLTNFFLSNRWTATMLKKILGIATERDFPLLHHTTLDNWFRKNSPNIKGTYSAGSLLLFNDEFTRFTDTGIGIEAILLLTHLGFDVQLPRHTQSGRAMISKGLLRKARSLADENVERLWSIVSSHRPLVGIEPSAVLSFRDEYPELVSPKLRTKAKQLAENCFTIEEFLYQKVQEGKINRDLFTNQPATVFYHGHCHQKALASTKEAVGILGLPKNWIVKEIQAGCCGMAGSFGYEAEHYKLSMKIGELKLFPAVRKLEANNLIAASGTSCRQQIADGTSRIALHPISLLYRALNDHPFQ